MKSIWWGILCNKWMNDEQGRKVIKICLTHKRSERDVIKILSQQVAKSFFARNWECLLRFWTDVVSTFHSGNDTTDGTNGAAKPWRCFVSVFRNIFSRRSRRRNETKIYPRLVLPPINLQFEYNMSHPKRGVALIFNHEYFLREDKTKRTGTEKDRDRLSEVLERLDFDVKTFDDLSFKEMMKELNESKIRASFDRRPVYWFFYFQFRRWTTPTTTVF